MVQEKLRVWITGGGSGLGRGLAHEFARAGHHVVVSGRRQQALEETAAAAASQISVVVADVNDDQAIKEAYNSVVAALGAAPNVVIANAGFSVGGMIDSLQTEAWRRQFETNIFGLINTVRVSIADIQANKGRLVLMGSTAGFLPLPGNAPYCASKAAVESIGGCLSVELAKYGATCTTIFPGFVESDIARVDNRGVLHPERKETRPEFLLWPLDKASRVMTKAILRRKQMFVFTGHGRLGAFMGRHFPRLVLFSLKRLPQMRKKASPFDIKESLSPASESSTKDKSA